MAEDDLLVNFSIGDEPITSKAAVTGGTWRARRRVQKQEQWVHNSAKRRADAEEEPRAKKQRVESGDFPEETREEAQQGVPVRANGASQKGNTQWRPKQVISSLFSYNPEPTMELSVSEPKNLSETVEPSNAPLSQEETNFTSLGLDPRITTHLTKKMDIKKPTAIQKASLEKLLTQDTDALIQAETGSGKTLAYVLPILHRLIRVSADLKAKGGQGLSRTSGLFAIILVPTRELSKQIAAVLESLLRCANWLVAGSVIGGENKNHEKARLRNGLNILVATPGRLADHMDTTSILDASQVRWLVLDEGDRLMELGFEEDLKKIINKLDNRLARGKQAPVEGLPEKRINILCSATMKTDVQKLGEISLTDAIQIQAEKAVVAAPEPDAPADGPEEKPRHDTAMDEQSAFSAPAQLKQSYFVVPAKLRLVTLYAFLKGAFVGRGSVKKAIVFISCADSVDFHFEAFTHTGPPGLDAESGLPEGNDTLEVPPVEPRIDRKSEKIRTPHAKRKMASSRGSKTTESDFIKTWAKAASLFGEDDSSLYVYRLHGSLPQSLRTTTLKSFKKTDTPAVLLCTDVASRGLDLPDVDLVVEYDPPFSKDDHLHRIGRTARAGRDGRATIFLLPGCEEGYTSVLQDERKDHGAIITGFGAEDHLRQVFQPRVDKLQFEKDSKLPRTQRRQLIAAHSKSQGSWEDAATEWQLEIERWALNDPTILEMARRAYQSHIRAYATHVAKERQIFDMKELHLGHLAKAFGLRDKPGSVNVPGLRQSKDKVKSDRSKAGGGASGKRTSGAKNGEAGSAQSDAMDAGRKMRMMARKMATAGASEFNLA